MITCRVKMLSEGKEKLKPVGVLIVSLCLGCFFPLIHFTKTDEGASDSPLRYISHYF